MRTKLSHISVEPHRVYMTKISVHLPALVTGVGAAGLGSAAVISSQKLFYSNIKHVYLPQQTINQRVHSLELPQCFCHTCLFSITDFIKKKKKSGAREENKTSFAKEQ